MLVLPLDVQGEADAWVLEKQISSLWLAGWSAANKGSVHLDYINLVSAKAWLFKKGSSSAILNHSKQRFSLGLCLKWQDQNTGVGKQKLVVLMAFAKSYFS